MTTFFHIWKYPTLIGVFTLFGLLAALTGTGLWHVLSWVALAVPIITCIRFGLFSTTTRL
jgi:hypothetical protein